MLVKITFSLVPLPHWSVDYLFSIIHCPSIQEGSYFPTMLNSSINSWQGLLWTMQYEQNNESFLPRSYINQDVLPWLFSFLPFEAILDRSYSGSLCLGKKRVSNRAVANLRWAFSMKQNNFYFYKPQSWRIDHFPLQQKLVIWNIKAWWVFY